MSNIEQLELITQQIKDELPYNKYGALLNQSIASATCTLALGILATTTSDATRARIRLMLDLNRMEADKEHANKARAR